MGRRRWQGSRQQAALPAAPHRLPAPLPDLYPQQHKRRYEPRLTNGRSAPTNQLPGGAQEENREDQTGRCPGQCTKVLYTALIWSAKNFTFPSCLRVFLFLKIRAFKRSNYIDLKQDIYLKDIILALSWGAQK